jgi:hypothetical protein
MKVSRFSQACEDFQMGSSKHVIICYIKFLILYIAETNPVKRKILHAVINETVFDEM